MKREHGFYWVRINYRWFIAEWTHDRWIETGDWHGFHDSRYDEIIESPVPHPNNKCMHVGDQYVDLIIEEPNKAMGEDVA